MSVTTRTVYVIECDRADCPARVEAEDAAEAERRARMVFGWMVISYANSDMNEHYCHAHLRNG